MIRITTAQINPTIGDITGNIALMLSAAFKARDDRSQMVVFPEMALTGYYPGDLLDEQHFIDRIQAGIEALKAATRATPSVRWVVGAPLRRHGVGKTFFNGLLVIQNGVELMTYAKQLLPTYGVFDELRHFEPGPDVARVLRVDDTLVGFLICEDAWGDDETTEYAVNPFQRVADASPDLIISINASPSNVGKREVRQGVISKACAKHGVPLLYVAQVGGQDALVFDGASFAVEADGKVVFEAARFDSQTTTIFFDRVTRKFPETYELGPLTPVPAEGLPTMEFYRQQIILGLKDYARRCGFKKVVVGCSGGIDSALTLALAVEALGADNVAAITMPSSFSSAGSVNDSQTLCDNLGIPLDTVPIRDIMEQFGISMMASTLAEPPVGLALENLQARIRGTLLMTYSNLHGHLLLTTGNKSEVSVGYCTLYGDTNGGLGLIGDLYKTEVFDLCRHINATAGRELIPAEIIEKPPSAELAPGQVDTDSLPPYEVLDDILRIILERGRLSKDEATAAEERVAGLESTDEGRALIVKIRKMISRNEYKRRQAPPTIRVRGRAFGSGRQVPIAAVHY